MNALVGNLRSTKATMKVANLSMEWILIKAYGKGPLPTISFANGTMGAGIQANPTPEASEAHIHLLVIVDVDDRLLPLASRNLALEHDVDLAVGSALHLRQVEVGGNQANESSASPDVTALASHVSILRHVSIDQSRERGGKHTAELSM